MFDLRNGHGRITPDVARLEVGDSRLQDCCPALKFSKVLKSLADGLWLVAQNSSESRHKRYALKPRSAYEHSY